MNKDIFDCGQDYCDRCDPSKNIYPCTGVLGGAQKNSPASKYGAYTEYMGNLRNTDSTDSTSVNCRQGENLGWYNSYGGCGDTTFTGINNENVMKTDILVVGSEKCAKIGNIIKDDNSWDKFPLQTLHKIWGDGGGKYNNGVTNENVYLSEKQETITYKIQGQSSNATQQVIVMEAHGDKYSGNIPGITTVKTANPKSKIPQCPTVTNAPGQRVGGVVATRGQYGPGVYNVLCYVPKTEDDETDGRGYVFAIWPFHYEEIYVGKNPQNDTTNSQARGNLSGPKASTDFPCFNQCDGGTTDSVKCTTVCSGSESDLFSVINHEIDIEIPNNSPQFADNWKDKMTWDTMNCNTWVNDIDNYDASSGAYYTQVAVKNPKGTFISDAPEKQFIKDYHWYTIDWYVDNSDYTNNYVKFYFDDPFDPTGKTLDPNGNPLPKKPSGTNISENKGYGFVHSTQRFVPTRAGRLNIGPWFGWWGYNGQKGGVPNFDTAKVRLAYVNVIPYINIIPQNNSGFSFPQNYDQTTPEGKISCDFRDLYSVSSESDRKKCKGPSIVTAVALGAVIVILIIIIIILSLNIFWANKK